MKEKSTLKALVIAPDDVDGFFAALQLCLLAKIDAGMDAQAAFVPEGKLPELQINKDIGLCYVVGLELNQSEEDREAFREIIKGKLRAWYGIRKNGHSAPSCCQTLLKCNLPSRLLKKDWLEAPGLFGSKQGLNHPALKLHQIMKKFPDPVKNGQSIKLNEAKQALLIELIDEKLRPRKGNWQKSGKKRDKSRKYLRPMPQGEKCGCY